MNERPLTIDTVDLCLSLVREERQFNHRSPQELDRAEQELKALRETFKNDRQEKP